MGVKQVNQSVLIVRMVFLFSVLAVFTGVVSATTITVQNSNFQSGADADHATGWSSAPADVYYYAGGDYDSGGIRQRAASLKATGNARIAQDLGGVYCNSYDVYKISFDVGYRNDVNPGVECTLRVYLKDSNAGEIEGEDIIIGEPDMDNSQYPNVGTVMRRTVVLKVNRLTQPVHQLAICFKNKTTFTSPSRTVIVIDNISIEGYKMLASWQFDIPDFFEDATGEHNLNGLPGKSAAAASPGVDGEDDCLHTRESWNYCGVATPNSSAFKRKDFTVLGWVYMPSWALNLGDTRAVCGFRNRGSQSSGFILYATPTDHWEVQLRSSSDAEYLIGHSIASNRWVQLALSVRDISGGEVEGKLYTDGGLCDHLWSVPYNEMVPSSPFAIGVDWIGSSTYNYHFTGYIDDVRYYDYPMHELEVAEMYAKKLEDSPQIGEQFKVMSYNIQHLAGSDAVLAENIEDSNPDVLCLQEVQVWEDSQHDINNIDMICDRLEPGSYPYRAYVEAYEPSHKGNAILSKTPLLTVNEYTLPQGQSSQVRKMIVATTVINGRAYTIANTHFAHEDTTDGQEARELQAAYVVNTLSFCENPLILTGDLNDNFWESACDRLKQLFDDTRGGAGGVDHVLIGRNTFYDEVISSVRIPDPEEIASDHEAVVATFELQ